MIDDKDMAIAIRTAVKESGISASEIADTLNVTKQAVSNWMRNGKIDKRKLPALAALTGKSLTYFGMGDASLPPAIVAVTNPDYIRFQVLDVAGGMGNGVVNPDYPEVLREVDMAVWEVRRKLGFLPKPDRVKLITGRGSSMQPLLDNGDVALVDTAISHFDGDAVYVISLNGYTQIKQLQMRPDGLYVVSTNPQYPAYLVPPEAGDTLHIIGKVLGVIGVRQM